MVSYVFELVIFFNYFISLSAILYFFSSVTNNKSTTRA